ncbi:hypothetical protein ACFQE8_25385 [Salinirubellus sp. GCM10025818]|uniref:hypothetical protein n=1 Tax=unclassified Salinirubellus TaxID=2627207 RepID=UPI00360F899F
MVEDTTPSATDEPDPPDSAPKYIVEGLNKQDADTLHELADYAKRLAEWRTAQAAAELEEEATDVDGTPEEWDDDEWDDALDEAREKAELPSGKGALTVKTIDDRGYYYLQWREGSTVKSQYVAPVSPADSG